MIPGFDSITAPAYVAGLTDLSLDTVRSRRDEAQDLENAVSYVRRVAHGRLDIAGTQLAARVEGAPAAGLEDLVEQLPGALAESGSNPGLPQRAAQALEPLDEIVAPIMEGLDAIVGPAELGSLPDLDDESLAAIVEQLREYEIDISVKRRTLHDVIDELQAEIGRRYQAGEVSVDSLLS